MVGFSSATTDHQSHAQSKSDDGQRSVSHSVSPSSLRTSYSDLPGPSGSHRHAHPSTSTPSVDAFGVSRSRVTSSPDSLRRSDGGTHLNVVPEDRIIMEFPATEHVRTPLYTGGAPMYDEEEDSEEEERELDQELEEHGLYRGSYRRLVLLYSLTPITFLLFFVVLAALPSFVYPTTEPWPYSSAPYLPHPFPELLTSFALFALSHLLLGPLTTLSASLFPDPPPPASTALSTTLHTLISLVLQQSALLLLLVAQYTPPHPKTHDPAFRRVWWLALGWAAAEAVAAISRGYAARALYRDVLVSVRRSAVPDTETSTDVDIEAEVNVGRGVHKPEARPLGPMGLASGSGSGSGSRSRAPQMVRVQSQTTTVAGQGAVELFERAVADDIYPRPFSEDDLDEAAGERQPLLQNGRRDARNGNAIKMQVEDELETLLAMRAREELEEAYGVPIIRIPVFLSCLQRINALLLTLGIYLLLSQAYLRSTVAVPLSPRASPPLDNPDQDEDHQSRSNILLALAVPVCALVQCALALLQTPPLLPRVGAPAAVYSASLVSLGMFFVGLAVWDGLS